MGNSLAGKVLIDPNLDSYKTFFDHEWCRQIYNFAQGSALESSVDSLMIAWRSASGSHLLPWLMATSLPTYASGQLEGTLQFRDSYSERIISGLVAKITSKMQASLTTEQTLKLQLAVMEIESEAFEALKASQSTFDSIKTDYWSEIVTITEFQFSILGTQRLNFSAIFFAYEDFLANAIRTKEPQYTSKSKKDPIGIALERLFGDKNLAEFCWSQDDVDMARLIRNSLAHNSGRFGTDLKRYEARFPDVSGETSIELQGNQFYLIEDTIQITPCNNKYLFDLLKDRVTKVVERLT